MTTPRKIVLRVAAPMITACALVPSTLAATQEGRFEELKAGAAQISGVFEYQGHRIRVETLRGKRTPIELRRHDPGAPQFEIDIRFVDESGYPFFVQFGGHAPINESWLRSESGLPEDLAVPSDEQSSLNFLVAERALESLLASPFKAAWAPEQRVLEHVLPAMREALAMDVREPMPEKPATKATCNFRHVLSVYKGPAFLGLFGSQHSATRATNVSSTGRITQIWASTNHGRSYSESGMSFFDSWTGYNRCALGSMTWPKCATKYGISRGQHVCNDDSVIQCQSLQTLSTPTGTSGTCSDSTLRLQAPRCD